MLLPCFMPPTSSLCPPYPYRDQVCQSPIAPLVLLLILLHIDLQMHDFPLPLRVDDTIFHWQGEEGGDTLAPQGSSESRVPTLLTFATTLREQQFCMVHVAKESNCC